MKKDSVVYKKRDEEADLKIKEMKKTLEEWKISQEYIRKLVAYQNGELNVKSRYYKGNIAEGNWCIVKETNLLSLDDEKIKTDFDALDVIYGLDRLYKEEIAKARKKDSEYEYVFIPSYYAIKTLIIYYLKNREKATEVYNLKNAVVRKVVKGKNKFFYGGLPFILKYLKHLPKRAIECIEIKDDFAKLVQSIFDKVIALNANQISDEFIQDIIECIENSGCYGLVIEKRIKDIETDKTKYIHYMKIDEYEILEHNDVDKDLKLLKAKGQDKKAEAKIEKTPKHPYNNSPKDSESLRGDLREWYSQRINKKDRLVYRKDPDKKVVYIASAYDHYKNTARRTKSTSSYK